MALLALLLLPRPAGAYSVLSHEEVVDMAWTTNIVPLLNARFPGLTGDQLREAHSYAYGGSVIQDIGYYPFGSHYFSDLLHYVRTGDFVTALIKDSTTPDEFAFALGALAHYCGDTIGHPFINEVTAREYPKLHKRFGTSVTYAEDPTAHLRTEFGFDVVEVAHGRYSQKNYHDFIGFQVAQPLLERAFREIYGMDIKDVLTHEALAISTYRRSVSHLIPQMTKVALVKYGKDIQKEDPTFDRSKFLYRLNRTQFRREYGREYKAPGFGAHLVAFLFWLVPKVGPFRALQLTIPTPADQDLYFKSVNNTVDNYRMLLAQAKDPVIPQIADLDLDTGKPSQDGEYPLADKSYARLLASTVSNENGVNPALRDHILSFYADPAAPDALQKNPQDWQALQANLVKLKAESAPVFPSAPNTTATLR